MTFGARKRHLPTRSVGYRGRRLPFDRRECRRYLKFLVGSDDQISCYVWDTFAECYRAVTTCHHHALDSATTAMNAAPAPTRQSALKQPGAPSTKGVLRGSAQLLPTYRPLRASVVPEPSTSSAPSQTSAESERAAQISRRSRQLRRDYAAASHALPGYYASAAYILPGYASPQVRLTRTEDAGWLSNSFLQRACRAANSGSD